MTVVKSVKIGVNRFLGIHLSEEERSRSGNFQVFEDVGRVFEN